ncbi:cell division protein ZapA [Ruminococcus sp.]|uniref:cell division protein ZapA n=1 Tax=Ruminococcus sp. TaxID=41978 RepID=UPI0025F27A60|nr:cell division protein ZapA [Ruminococcus sp.]
MKNKLKVTIYNRTYNLLSEETQGYTDKLAATINTKINAMLKGIPSISVQDAAVLTALDCLDELSKANQNIENIRTQIKDYVDDAGRARSQADEAQKEIRELKAKIADLEAQLEVQSAEPVEMEEEVVDANALLSQEIKNALESPVHSSHSGDRNNNTNYVGTVNYRPEGGSH